MPNEEKTLTDRQKDAKLIGRLIAQHANAESHLTTDRVKPMKFVASDDPITGDELDAFHSDAGFPQLSVADSIAQWEQIGASIFRQTLERAYPSEEVEPLYKTEEEIEAKMQADQRIVNDSLRGRALGAK